jgi:hypothetical protein
MTKNLTARPMPLLMTLVAFATLSSCLAREPSRAESAGAGSSTSVANPIFPLEIVAPCALLLWTNPEYATLVGPLLAHSSLNRSQLTAAHPRLALRVQDAGCRTHVNRNIRSLHARLSYKFKPIQHKSCLPRAPTPFASQVSSRAPPPAYSACHCHHHYRCCPPQLMAHRAIRKSRTSFLRTPRIAGPCLATLS